MFTTIAFLLHRLATFSVLFVQEAKPSDFDDFGMLLLTGALVAVAVGVAFTLIKQKAETREGKAAQFISIKSSDKDEP
jgi:hypothetical protein